VSAAPEVAVLLDRQDLSLTDVELRAAPRERRVYEPSQKANSARRLHRRDRAFL